MLNRTHHETLILDLLCDVQMVEIALRDDGEELALAASRATAAQQSTNQDVTHRQLLIAERAPIILALLPILVFFCRRIFDFAMLTARAMRFVKFAK